MKNYLVYKHTSPSGKSYIGITNNYQKRCYEHRKIYNECSAFRNAIQKHGWDNFKHEILKQNLAIEEANYWEEFYISKHKTMSPYGYNLTSGGKVFSMSEESNRRKGDSRKGVYVGNKSPLFGLVGGKNHQSKSYKITDPNGSCFIVTGLLNFCKSRSLNDAAMSNVANGNVDHHKGYKCEHINNELKIQGEKRRLDRFDKAKRRKKTYKLTDPEGRIHVITGLSGFCKENGLRDGCMANILTGRVSHHKGWKCEYYSDMNKHL